MGDEAMRARFVAYCRAHPAWFAAGFLRAMASLDDLELVAPAQLAWQIVLDTYAREIDDGPAEDAITGPIGWKAGG